MNNVALITGGTRGIGLGIAHQLAAEGYDLALNGKRPAEAVATVVADLKKSGRQVLYCQGDIASTDTRQALLNQIKTHYGALHVLVNNAGIAPPERRDILDGTEASFNQVINTNLKGPYFLTQAVAHWMIEQRQADAKIGMAVINITSVSAELASVNRGEYCVAKAGLCMTSKLFAARLGEYQIPVYEVRPGIIRTDMTSGVQEKYETLLAEGLCIQARWGMPEDVGRAVAALVRGDFGYSSGQVFQIDGGMTVPRL